VSQQALPDKLKGDTKGLTDLAKSIGAKQIIETPRGKAYIATDDKTGGQMVVTYTTDLLIFLRSEKTLDPLEWSDYIANLTIKR
jgi:hypothetical protein